MRSLRVLAVIVTLLGLLVAPVGPAQASSPEHSNMQWQGGGAVAIYPLASGNGEWYVGFGTISYTMNGETVQDQMSVAAGLFESSCTADGSRCSVYGVDGGAVVPPQTFTIDANLGAAHLSPIPLTAQGYACTWGWDDQGQSYSQCQDITVTTTVSASLFATGAEEVTPYHEVSRSDGAGGYGYRSIISDVTLSRPATGTASAFDVTDDSPSWGRIARQSSTNVSTYWPSFTA